jgi:HK97 family phage prohead protease
MREKQCFGFVADEKAIDIEGRRIRFVISTDEIDRDREIVQQEAVEKAIKAFGRNPVCLACHQHRSINGTPTVIGSWDIDSYKRSAHKSEMDLVFAKTALAEEYWQLYRDKHMRAVSIGFGVIDGAPEVRSGSNIYVITTLELYEISCVAIPANASALSKLKSIALWEETAVEKALIDFAARLEAIEKRQAERLDSLKETLLSELDSIKDMIPSDPDGLAKSLLPGSDEELSDGAEKTGRAVKYLQNVLNILTGD